MSRSVRKPWFTEGYRGRWRKIAKRWANKKVRKTRAVPDGSAYKRCYESWDICDWKFRWEPDDCVPEWKARRK